MTSRNRDIDSIKGSLIVLVIFGHLIEPSIDRSQLFKMAYTAIYMFHMPLFVLLSGVFSKDAMGARDYWNLFRQVLLPLVVFQVLYLLPTFISKGVLPHPLMQPHWILWFLFSLATWRLSLPLFAKVPLRIPLAFLIAILAGYEAGIGYAFSLSRTLYFLPFFLFGHEYGQPIMRWAREHPGLCVALLAVPVAMGWVGLSLDVPPSVLYGSVGYAQSGRHLFEPAIERALILGLSLAASIGFAGLACRHLPGMPYLGERSLIIFLTHGFVVIGLNKACSNLHAGSTPLLLAALALVALSVAFVLAKLESTFKFSLECLGGSCLRRRPSKEGVSTN